MQLAEKLNKNGCDYCFCHRYGGQSMIELIVAAFKTGSATVANLLVTAITVKIIAMFTGPAGVGAWSLLRQCQQSAVAIGTCSGAISFIRGISQLSGKERSQFIRTVAVTYLLLGGCVTLGMILLSARLASWVGTLNAHIFALLAVPVAIGILRDYLIALLNGMRAIGRLALAQIFGAVAAALMAYPVALLVAKGDFSGFVLLMLTVGVISSLAAIYFIWRAKWGLDIVVRPYWTLDSFKRFAGLAGTLATIGIVASVTLFACRVLIARYRGINEAGYFDVAWSLGLTYVGLILNAFGTYYLPKLSSMADKEQVELIQYVGKLTIMAMTPLIVLMTLIKPWIISMFYSAEFMPSLGIFQLLLVADYLKMSTWVFSIVVMVRGLEKPFLIGNVLWDLGLLFGVWITLYLGLPSNVIGVVAVVLNCFGLFGYNRLMSKTLPIHFPLRLWFAWIAGLLCVLGATALTWNGIRVDFSLYWILIISCLVSWVCLSKDDLKAIHLFFLHKKK
jgi:antigen flippase